MSKRTPNEIGEALEEYVEQEFGAKRVSQSGAGPFLKLDNRGGTFVFSCKGTDKASMTVRKSWLQELKRVAKSVIGGGHANVRGVLFIEIDGERAIMIDPDLFYAMITHPEDFAYLPPDKATQRQRRASGSLLPD